MKFIGSQSSRSRALRWASSLSCALVLAGCSGTGTSGLGEALPVSPASLDGWQQDDLQGLAGALGRQCALPTPPAPWPALCADLRPSEPGLKERIGARLQAWPLRGQQGQPEALVTGYYEPQVHGSRERDGDRQVPLYRKPADLLRVEVPLPGAEPGAAPPSGMRGRLAGDRVLPYPSRADIETGQALRGQELLWLDDPVEAFFLQIQGSGRVRLRDGSLIGVGFADSNGQPYRAIGRVLIERGELPREGVDTAAIKDWLRSHPQQADEVMRSNPRYVFFRELPPAPVDAGPPGSLGVPLTPLRSVAADPQRIPAGALLYLSTTDPLSGAAIRRMVVSQDTGAAITGPARVDLFWGAGPQAEASAGRMRAAGRLWLLWPLDTRPPPSVFGERR